MKKSSNGFLKENCRQRAFSEELKSGTCLGSASTQGSSESAGEAWGSGAQIPQKVGVRRQLPIYTQSGRPPSSLPTRRPGCLCTPSAQQREAEQHRLPGGAPGRRETRRVETHTLTRLPPPHSHLPRGGAACHLPFPPSQAGHGAVLLNNRNGQERTPPQRTLATGGEFYQPVTPFIDNNKLPQLFHISHLMKLYG